MDEILLPGESLLDDRAVPAAEKLVGGGLQSRDVPAELAKGLIDGDSKKLRCRAVAERHYTAMVHCDNRSSAVRKGSDCNQSTHRLTGLGVFPG